jgi:predicted DsbA family dithiol-disulfide isomerase
MLHLSPFFRASAMTSLLKIDFVSDISCPWCAIGLAALERALVNLPGNVGTQLHVQPFELNPQMPAGGQDISEHLTQKYGSTSEQQAQIRDTIRQRIHAVPAVIIIDRHLISGGQPVSVFEQALRQIAATLPPG